MVLMVPKRWFYGKFSAGETAGFLTRPPHYDENEVEMLRMAIAMFFEGQEAKQLCSETGAILSEKMCKKIKVF